MRSTCLWMVAVLGHALNIYKYLPLTLLALARAKSAQHKWSWL